MPPGKFHLSVLRGPIGVSTRTFFSLKLSKVDHFGHFRSTSHWNFQNHQKWYKIHQINVLCGCVQQRHLATTQKRFGFTTDNPEPQKPKKTIQNYKTLTKYILQTDLSIEISIAKNQSSNTSEDKEYITKAEREEKALQDFLKENESLGRTKYSNLIGDLITAKRFREAYAIFRQTIGNNQCPLDHMLLTLYVKVLAGLDKLDMIDELHTELKTNYQGTLDHILYTAILDTFANKKDIPKILFYLKEMTRGGLKPNIQNFTTLLNAVNFEDHEMVCQVLDKLDQYEIEKDSAVYNLLMSKFGKLGKTKDAIRFLKEMKQKKVQPSLVTFNTLIHIHSRQGEIDHMIQRFEEMTKMGVDPDIITYSTLIHGLVKAGQLPNALELLKGMQSTGMIPDIFIFTDLISAFGIRGDINNVLACINLMLDFGIEPDLFTYTALIQAYGVIGDTESVKQVVETMERNNIQPDERAKFAIAQCLKNKPELTKTRNRSIL